MKIRVAGIALILALEPLASLSFAVDETKPYGRVCITELDPAAKTEAVLADSTTAGPGRGLLVHLDANTACDALVAAFSKTSGDLASGWRPVLLNLREWDEQTAPTGNERWAWAEPSEPFEIIAVFLPKGMPGSEKVRDLVTKLRDPKAEPALLKMQARQLREELLKWAVNDAAISVAPASAPAQIGGTVRSASGFSWRDFARKLNFSATKPGVTVYQHAGK